ncbi:MAG: HAD family hydrolase [Candidatus Methanodesulfokora sp.]
MGLKILLKDKVYKIDAAIVDLDQTIVDTIHRFHRCFNETMETFHLKGLEWEDFINAYIEDSLDNFIEVDINAFWHEFSRKMCGRIEPEDRLFPGSIDVLSMLRKNGIKIALATGRGCLNEELVKELSYFGLAGFFDLICSARSCSPDNSFLWSKRGIIRHVIREFRVNAANTILIADYWTDMKSAKEEGVIAIGVLTGFESKEKLLRNGADLVLNGIWELPSILDKLI